MFNSQNAVEHNTNLKHFKLLTEKVATVFGVEIGFEIFMVSPRGTSPTMVKIKNEGALKSFKVGWTAQHWSEGGENKHIQKRFFARRRTKSRRRLKSPQAKQRALMTHYESQLYIKHQISRCWYQKTESWISQAMPTRKWLATQWRGVPVCWTARPPPTLKWR